MIGTARQPKQISLTKGKRVVQLFQLALILCMAAFIAGCSQTGTAASEQASGASGTSSNSGPDSSSNSNSISESDYVGSWEVVQVIDTSESAEGESGEDAGESAEDASDETADENSSSDPFSQEGIEKAREKGLDHYVVLNPDGSAVYVIQGIYYYGNWEIDDELAEIGLENGVSAVFSGPSGDKAAFAATIHESDLLLMYPKRIVQCKKTEDKQPLSKEEHDAALDAFVGTWHVVSATRDGVTITTEAGQITNDMTLDFRNDMTVTLTNNEDSTDAPWGISGADSGYVYNPVTGDALTISDGVLTEDLGEMGTMTFEKE